MNVAKIQDLPQAFASVLLSVLTSSYSGAYAYHTFNPIENIKDHQQHEGHMLKCELIKASAHFHHVKSDELSFVTKAVSQDLFSTRRYLGYRKFLTPLVQATLSAAAAVAVFSWPTVETTVWAARMLWHWSFFTSSFSLISSAHQRLLRHLPEKDDDLEYNEDKIRLALTLFLQPPLEPASPSAKVKQRRISRRMLWVWQCPTMLMSYSWVLFLVGYALHVLNPVFDPSQADISPKVG